jgi:hypothetical protein
VTTPARIVFGLLVASTFAAFFVAQRLKHTPAIVQDVSGAGVFSPNGDGRQDRLRVTFELKHAATISADAIDREGDPVRSLLNTRRVRAHQAVALVWRGRSDQGGRAPDGFYRIRVTLGDEGRTVVIHRRFRLDTTPPRPVVTGVGPSTAPGPELLPDAGRGAIIHTQRAGADASVTIWRTSGAAPVMIARLPLTSGTATWDGMASGRPAPAGSYVAVAQWRDGAGNLGSSTPVDRATGAPVLRYATRFPGRGGITVRYLELQPPTGPPTAGAPLVVGVDARGARYRWDLRALGVRRPVLRGTTRGTPLRLRAPHGPSAVYLFEASSGGHTAATPIAVDAGGAGAHVLVVLPLMTWQGRNPVDDDGDGSPDTLERGATVRTGRVFAGGALPRGFRDAEGPLLAFLSRHHRTFDVTTDVALAAGRGPRLAGHHGVLLPGDVRWLPHGLQLTLRDFVHAGGTLLLTGVDSLRREVTLAPDGRLERPTAPAPVNLFGSRLRPVANTPTSVTNLTDHVGLFSGGISGGTGVFAGFAGNEATLALGGEEKLAADAVTADSRPVIVAARFGKGLEIRTGLVGFATRLNADANAGTLVVRSWALLAGR